VSFILLSFSQSIEIIGICAFGFGLGVSTTTASTSALVSEYSRKGEYGTALGALSSVMDMGHSAGPLITGFLISIIGFSLSYATVALLLILSAIFFMILVNNPTQGD
jgi:MFS family permease